MPCLQSENFSQIMSNPVFGKYFKNNLISSLDEWKNDVKNGKGKILYYNGD
jgi:hypothetical protein